MLSASRKNLLRLLMLFAVLALAFYLSRLAQGSETVQSLVSGYGYLGVFIVSLASGFNLLVPIPAVAFMPLFLESGLGFAGSTAVMVLGMTAADGLAFLLARTGRQAAAGPLEENRIFKKLDRLRQRYHYLPLVVLFFFAAFAPLPNETLLVPMAFLGYKFKTLMPIVLAANVVFILAYSQIILGLFDVI